MEKIHIFSISALLVIFSILIFMTSSVIANASGLSSLDVPYARIMMSVPTKGDYHNVVIETCARNSVLTKPELLVFTDLEEKTIPLGQGTSINDCAYTGAQIKFSDPDSISLTLISQDKNPPKFVKKS